MNLLLRWITCLAFGLGIAIAAMVLRFVWAQSASAMRSLLFLNPLGVAAFAPVAICGFAVTWLLTRRQPRDGLAASLVLLAVACMAWYAVDRPPLAGWLLPPVAAK